MKKKILLINPWIYDFKAYDSWKKPLGLLYIADILNRCGYEISLIDCIDRNDSSMLENYGKSDKFGCGQYYRETITKPEIFKSIYRNYKKYGITEERFSELAEITGKPDLVLVTSAMTYWYPGVFRAIEILKKLYPDTPVILGGIYATLCRTHAVKFSKADHVISGAFNKDAIRLIDSLTGNEPTEYQENIFMYRPQYRLYEKLSSISMITSVGCPYSCSYCAGKLLQPEYFTNSTERVLEEIKFYADEFKIKHIAFFDDALLFKYEDHLKKILDGLISADMGINCYTPNGLHARFITSEIAEKMHQAKFKNLRVSLETSNPDLQSATGGKVTNPEFEQAVKHLKNAGYESDDIGVYIMQGLPGQKIEEVYNTIKYVNSLGVKIKMVQYSPLPGSAEWNNLPLKIQEIVNNEPLWQNDIPFLHLSGYIGWDENQKIKILVKQLNRQLNP